MEHEIVKFMFVSSVWTSLYLPSNAASPICNTQPLGLIGYGQSCGNDSQCVTDLCYNSTCACDYGTTYSSCAAACVADCDRTLKTRTGAITSPDYPSSSPTTYCTWTIQGSQRTIIAFNIAYMDMGADDNCTADYIEIFDGADTSSRTFGKMCTSWQTMTLSTTNYMLVVFNSSGSGRFLATFKNLGTTITLSEPQGYISSPGYPLGYLNNMFYSWTIQGDADTYIVLDTADFYLESSYFDYLKIYDGPTNTSHLFGNFCFTSSPGIIASTSNSMYLQFKTDDSETSKGFYGNYKIRERNSTLTTSNGTIISPGYPASSPPVYCTWAIQGSTETIIALNITYMNMGEADNCTDDYIEIFDGADTSSRTFDKTCTYRQTLTLSSTNYMLVVFKSSGSGRFLATYQSLGKHITLSKPKGFISSPGYPLGYINNTLYNWIIQGDDDTYIVLNISDFELESSCHYDYLRIFDGSIYDSRLIGSFCGSFSPAVTSSISNSMRLEFSTRFSSTLRGFYGHYEIRGITEIAYKANCTETERCKSNLLCLNATCSCDTDFYYNGMTAGCTPGLDHYLECNDSVTAMCKSSKHLGCLPDVNRNARCLCMNTFYFGNNTCLSTENMFFQRPQAKNKNKIGVELQWEASTHGSNILYKVSWVSASDETDRGRQAANESGVTVIGLRPGTNYTITVYTVFQPNGFYTARNISNVLSIVTYPAQPGPVNTTTSKLDKPPYIIRFQPSEGRVKTYLFNFESNHQLLSMTVTSPEVNIPDLQAGTDYKYSIKAVNSIGDESGEVEGSFKTETSEAELNTRMIIGALVFVVLLVVVSLVIHVRILHRNAKAKQNTSNSEEQADSTNGNEEAYDSHDDTIYQMSVTLDNYDRHDVIQGLRPEDGLVNSPPLPPRQEPNQCINLKLVPTKNTEHTSIHLMKAGITKDLQEKDNKISVDNLVISADKDGHLTPTKPAEEAKKKDEMYVQKEIKNVRNCGYLRLNGEEYTFDSSEPKYIHVDSFQGSPSLPVMTDLIDDEDKKSYIYPIDPDHPSLSISYGYHTWDGTEDASNQDTTDTEV